jgi:hypothetical protein
MNPPERWTMDFEMNRPVGTMPSSFL